MGVVQVDENGVQMREDGGVDRVQRFVAGHFRFFSWEVIALQGLIVLFIRYKIAPRAE